MPHPFPTSQIPGILLLILERFAFRNIKFVAQILTSFNAIPDDLKRIIGSDTTRRGMLCVFEMFQHQALNRRLVYVLMEGMLASLFPNNKFCELFRQWHAPSPTISMVSVHSGGAKSPLATPEMAHRQIPVPQASASSTAASTSSSTSTVTGSNLDTGNR